MEDEFSLSIPLIGGCSSARKKGRNREKGLVIMEQCMQE